jgi:hypothetical protein
VLDRKLLARVDAVQPTALSTTRWRFALRLDVPETASVYDATDGLASD